MKITQNIYLTTAFIALLSTTSCDFIFAEANQMSDDTQAVKTDKIEASLLETVAEKNLNCIVWCKTIEETTDNEEVKVAAQRIKIRQLEIAQNLQTTATENMILVASKPTNFTLDNLPSRVGTNAEIKSIQLLQENLNYQKQVMDSLLKSSDNITIIGMARENIDKIKSNIEITQSTLESLEYN